MHTIPPRCRIAWKLLRLHGYTEPEKVEIAKQFLVKKQMAQAGLNGEKRPVPRRCAPPDDSRLHARSGRPQPGARNRQRLPQSRAQGGQEGANFAAAIEPEKNRRLSRRAQVPRHAGHEKSEIGLVTGLAWTEVGGSILSTEATVVERQRQAHLNRQTRRRNAGIGAGRHVLHSFPSLAPGLPATSTAPRHSRDVPEGAIPKDGPPPASPSPPALAAR